MSQVSKPSGSLITSLELPTEYDEYNAPRINGAAEQGAQEAINFMVARWADGGVGRLPSRTSVPAGVEGGKDDDRAVPLTAEQLQRIIPSLGERSTELAANLNSAMEEARITTRTGQALFIAQMAVESANFSAMQENTGKVRYNGRIYDYHFYMYDRNSPNPARRRKALELGNTEPGDGARFRGRGYIQLTGRNNYRAAGLALGLDLLNRPELASEEENAILIAGWYWRDRGLNRYAQRDSIANFNEVTRRINGAVNAPETHRARRLDIYQRAKEVLGVNSGARR